MANVSNLTNATNATNATLGNLTSAPICAEPLCCEHEIRSEAWLACREYEALGVVSNDNCGFWADYAVGECKATCGDCAKIARYIYDSCLFLLQTVIPWKTAKPYCKKTERDFMLYRCPSACINKAEECFTDTARSCNALCGNYNGAPALYRDGCDCIMQRTAVGQPDDCFGETVLEGPIWDKPGLTHNCRLIPDDCKSHRDTSCGFYKHCPVDVCVVMNVTCPNTDSCQNNGVCASSNGRCYYQPKLDNTPCDDGLFYTYNDLCFMGTCSGLVDRCLRDDIRCSSPNTCLRATDKVSRGCDPPTGHCIFEPLPDGTPCASFADPGAGARVDGHCAAGLCRRSSLAVDACANVTCPRPGPCFEVPPCLEGACVPAQPLPEGVACDDGEAASVRDRCIEGRCVGDPLPGASFHELGAGSCAGQSLEALPLAVLRYSADVPDRGDCEAQCAADPECMAFSHGYQTCSVFGTKRGRSPDPAVWGRPWQLEPVPVQTLHATTCYRKVSGPPPTPFVLSRQALLALTISVLLLLPLIWLAFVGRGPLGRACLQVLSPDGAKKGGAKVAPAPSPPAAEPAKPAASSAPALTNAVGAEGKLVSDPRGEVD